jgi:cytochrome b561
MSQPPARPDQSIAGRRYSAGARWFHWITVVLIFTVIPLGWIFGAFKTKPEHPDQYVAPFPGTPNDYAAGHMTIGLLILAVVLARILYRLSNASPPAPERWAGWETWLARGTHWLLYAVLIIMPVSGYIMSAGDKPPISFLGLFDVPKAPITPAQGKSAAVVHVLVMQFVLYALIVLHLAGTAWHLFVRRDGILSRMLPRQDNEAA